ncbi:MAG TPA: hypothetical protein VL443_01630 [Cyclobacteriaceae bacterium]|jgi:hypothetical protein|nr:hypothetical protein [Cyclobacteriaceae bacterium]
MKSLLLILPILLIFSSCKQAESEFHLIPFGFEGSITIIFDCPNGEELVRDGNHRIYKIPKDGILKLKTHGNDGVLTSGAQRFFYIDSLGNKTEIEELLDNTQETTRDKTVVSNYLIYGDCVFNERQIVGSAVQYIVSSYPKREQIFKNKINPCNLYCK